MQICILRKDKSPKPVNHRLTLKGGPRSNLTTSEDSQPMISYRLVLHCKPLGLMTLLKTAMWGIWHTVDDLELRASRLTVCKVVEDMYICSTYHL